ncbi:MAG TPA: SRPBCC domain-containing protein [Acidimicrobiales bacterium]|nr:SRPBCC domain-containing protein [Acidimicrobiales bacterium]
MTRSVVLPAPPDEVWPALADPERLAAWLGGEVELEGRAGGRVVLADDDGLRWGTVELFQPCRVLALRLWERSAGLSGTRIEFTLDGVEEGTRLTVVETVLASPGGSDGLPVPAGMSRG